MSSRSGTIRMRSNTHQQESHCDGLLDGCGDIDAGDDLVRIRVCNHHSGKLDCITQPRPQVNITIRCFNSQSPDGAWTTLRYQTQAVRRPLAMPRYKKAMPKQHRFTHLHRNQNDGLQITSEGISVLVQPGDIRYANNVG